MEAQGRPLDSRRRRLTHRALPVAALAFFAFVVGVVMGAGHVPGEQRVAEQFAAAWSKGDYAAMWARLASGPQRPADAGALAGLYGTDAATATATSLVVGKPRPEGDDFLLPVTARTSAFGDVKGEVRLTMTGDGDQARVAWAPHMTFPGVPSGARLERRTSLPPRAALLARDNSPIDDSIKGELGPIPADRTADFDRAGYPVDAQVGISGLERIFERELAGTPGGELLAGGRTLASRPPRPGKDVRTTISPGVQAAAVTALAGRLGGVVAMNPRTGEILAAAGIAFSGLQPPGSTMKMITLAGALQNGIATPRSTYPLASSTVLSGVTLANANNEVCGGTLTQAFAISCNSVFAPLGAELGARRFLSISERFGFNKPSPVPGAATSVIPPAEEIGDDLALGSSAIGQGKVLATTLQMTLVGAAFGLDGRLPAPTLAYRAEAPERLGPRATSAKVARQVRRMMVEVVRNGTGVRAAIEGVAVAGKTGTAELRTTQACTPTAENPESCDTEIDPTDTTDTDAWFSAFAPAREPRVAVGVMLVSSGAGGDTAAPAARLVMVEALRRVR